MPKIKDLQIRKTLADLSPEPPVIVSTTAKPIVLRQSNSGIKFVQLVMDPKQKTDAAIIPQNAIKKEKLCKSELEDCKDNICTICGETFSEKSAFNAHIKVHLKEKLSRKMQQKQTENRSHSLKRKLDTSLELDQQPPSIKIKLEPELSLPEMDTPSPEFTNIEDGFMSSNCLTKEEPELNTDLSIILDQIEKDFDSRSIHLDTPPESDNDSDIFNFLSISEDDSSRLNKTPSPMMMVPPRLAESSLISDDIENLLNQTASDHDYLLNSTAPAAPNSCSLSAAPSSTLNTTAPPALPSLPSSPHESNISKVLISSQQSSPTKTFAIVNHTTGRVFIQREGAPARTLTMMKPTVNRPSDSANLISTAGNLSSASKIIESTKGVDGEKEYKIVLGNERESQKNKVKSKQIADCSICGKSITTKNMARHMEKHTGKKKFQCDICQASFFQKTHLKNHIVLHENGESHECQDCNQKFIRKTDLQKHQKSVHAAEIPNLCNHCGVHFLDPVSLELHVSNCSSDKPELCGMCGEKFKDKEAMIVHMQTTHIASTTDKPYSCQLCQKSFVQKGHLNRHMKSHNNPGGEELDLTCSSCSKSFPDRQLLDQHRVNCVGGGARLGENHRSRSMSSVSTSLAESDFTSLLSPGSLSSHDFDFFEEDSNCSTILSGSPGVGATPILHSRRSNIPNNYSESTRLDALDDNFCSFLNEFDSDGPLINDSISGDKSFSTSLEEARPNLTFNDISDASFFDISSQLDENIYDADLFSSLK